MINEDHRVEDLVAEESGTGESGDSDERGGTWCAQIELASSGAVTSVAPQSPEHAKVRALVRLHGEPLGYATVPAVRGSVDREQLLALAWKQWSDEINEHMVGEGHPVLDGLHVADLPLPGPTDGCPSRVVADSFVSIVVCTHNRSEMLPRCLASLRALTYPRLEVIVVDNAPSDGSTRAVVEKVMAADDRFRYVVEPQAGLSYARNKGLGEARGAIVAYTDDDVSVDPQWVEGIVRGFGRRTDVGCVTGLVCSASMSTSAEAYFDARAASWSMRIQPQVFQLEEGKKGSPLYPFSAGVFGTGANFAFDRSLLHTSEGFDEALGAGARTRGGEDLDAFVNTLLNHRAIVYEPSAIVWHHHRVGHDELLRQLYGYGTGFAAFITKCLMRRSTRWEVVRRIPAGFGRIIAIRSETKAALGEKVEFPKGAAMVEFMGYAAGPFLYAQARRANRRVKRERSD
ncbi:glycosyltransferase [Pseudonocardia sp. GCM10023141]|uniref:glycosyltransferase n=1 Tax=Pseudonocardia sp. GCM10023141 TaxID=3252653 RepID=UPI003624327D